MASPVVSSLPSSILLENGREGYHCLKILASSLNDEAYARSISASFITASSSASDTQRIGARQPSNGIVRTLWGTASTLIFPYFT